MSKVMKESDNILDKRCLRTLAPEDLAPGDHQLTWGLAGILFVVGAASVGAVYKKFGVKNFTHKIKDGIKNYLSPPSQDRSRDVDPEENNIICCPLAKMEVGVENRPQSYNILWQRSTISGTDKKAPSIRNFSSIDYQPLVFKSLQSSP